VGSFCPLGAGWFAAHHLTTDSQGGGDHIGLAVDDFEAAVTELRAKGVEFIVEPTDMGFAKFAFIQDAAGTTLEVIQVMKQN
jgi:catechol 2,3-dioxygenase-like lactoylglutathione lyase family enzyme